MLQLHTVEPATLALLKELQRLPELQNLHLVGGTALSLKYGHRLSIDLDLFSVVDFNVEEILALLETQFPDFRYTSATDRMGIFGFIQDIKVDLVKYQNIPLIRPINEEHGIRMFSVEDIAAMKINAALRRGVKKDFWDIAELLNHFTIEDLIKFYNEKYTGQQLMISIPQAIVYFEDAEDSPDPVSLKGQSWKKVKDQLQDAVDKFLS